MSTKKPCCPEYSGAGGSGSDLRGTIYEVRFTKYDLRGTIFTKYELIRTASTKYEYLQILKI